MSASKERLQEAWENSDSLAYHAERAQTAHEVIDASMITPKDGRLHISYDAMASGKGQQNSVMLIGPYAGGKTMYGNLLIGSDRRIDVDANDTTETLFGYPNPTDSEDLIPGKIAEAGSLDPVLQALHLNELGNNANSRIVNPLWDGPTVNAGGQTLTVEDLAVLASSNFVGKNVYALDGSTLSRMAIQVLMGDAPEDVARRIQGYVQSTNGNGPAFASPLLPKAPVRKTIHELVIDHYPDVADRSREGTTVSSNFIVDLGLKLNESGILTPVSIGDARLGQAFKNAARAYMFGRGVGIQEGHASQVPIAPIHLAKVAALVLPTMVEMSKDARHTVQEKTDSRLNDIEQAVVVRTAIARAAFELALQRDDQIRRQEDQFGRARTQEDIARDVERGVRDHAYADQDAVLRPDVKSAVAELLDPVDTDAEAISEEPEGANNGKRRITIPGIARFRSR